MLQPDPRPSPSLNPDPKHSVTVTLNLTLATPVPNDSRDTLAYGHRSTLCRVSLLVSFSAWSSWSSGTDTLVTKQPYGFEPQQTDVRVNALTLTLVHPTLSVAPTLLRDQGVTPL